MKISKKWKSITILGLLLTGLSFSSFQLPSKFVLEPTIVYADEEEEKQKAANEALSQVIGNTFDENGNLKDVVEEAKKTQKRQEEKKEAKKKGEEVPEPTNVAEKIQDAWYEAAEEKKEEEEGKVFEPSYTFALDELPNLTSKSWYKDDFFGLSSEMNYALNKIPQAIFWVAKFFFQIFGETYRHLNAFSDFSKYVDRALDTASQLFNGIFGMSNYAFFALALGITVTLAYVKFVMRGESFFVNLFRGLLPVFLMMALFLKTSNGYVMRQVYDSASTVGNEVADSALLVTNNLRKNDMSDKNIALLDTYFEKTIWTSFKHMNADPGEKDSGFVFSEEEFKRLVYYPDGKGDFKLGGEDDIAKLVGDGDKIKNHMMVDRIGTKVGIAFATILDVIAYGILIALIGIAKFALNIILIILLLLGVFAGLASLFPALERSIVEWFKRVFVTIFAANILSVFGIIFLWSFDLLTQMLNQVFNNNLIVVSFLKILIMWLIYRNRKWIIGIISGGRITGDIPALRKLKRMSSGRGFKSTGLNPITRNVQAKMRSAKNSIKNKTRIAGRKTGLAGREAMALAGVGFNSFKPVRAAKNMVNDGISYMQESTVGQLAKATREGVGAMSDSVSSSFNSLRAKAYDGKLGEQAGNEGKKEELLSRATRSKESARMRKDTMNQALASIKGGQSQASFTKETAKAQLSRTVVKRGQLNDAGKPMKTNKAGLERIRASSGVGVKATVTPKQEVISSVQPKNENTFSKLQGSKDSLKFSETKQVKARSKKTPISKQKESPIEELADRNKKIDSPIQEMKEPKKRDSLNPKVRGRGDL